MPYRIKYPVFTLIARLFLGLFMLASGIMMWKANPQPGEPLPGLAPGPLDNWLQAVIDTGYLWQWIATFKIINGMLVLIPRTAPLGILGAVPYYVNIMIYTTVLARLWLFLSVPAALATAYLVYAYWDRFKHIVAKQQ